MSYDLHVKYAIQTPRADIDAPYFYRGEKEETLSIYLPDGTPLMDDAGQPVSSLFAPTHIYGLYHQSVNVIFLVPKDGELYVVASQRSPTIFPFPGAYSVSVGGHIKVGESAIQNAIKEIREELGIDMGANRLLPIGNSRIGHRMFAKNWEYMPENGDQKIAIAQFDSKAEHLTLSDNRDFPNQGAILDYIKCSLGSPLISQAPIPDGLHLRNFNQEYGFYYLVLVSEEEYQARQVNPEEVAKATLILWPEFLQFAKDLHKTADAFYTLVHDQVLYSAFVSAVEILKASTL